MKPVVNCKLLVNSCTEFISRATCSLTCQDQIKLMCTIIKINFSSSRH